MGRPPVPKHLKRDKRMVVMLTDDEADQLASAAERDKSASLSDWIRETLLMEISVKNEITLLRAQAAEFWLFQIVGCHGLSTEATVEHINRMLEWARDEKAAKPGWVSGPFSWDAEKRLPYIEEVAQEILERLTSAE